MCKIPQKIIPTTSHSSTRETLMHNNRDERCGATVVVFNRSAVIAGRQKKKPWREPCPSFHKLCGMRDVDCDFGERISCQWWCRRRRRRRRRLGWLKGVESRARGCPLHKGRIRTIMRVIPCAYPCVRLRAEITRSGRRLLWAARSDYWEDASANYLDFGFYAILDTRKLRSVARIAEEETN